MTLDFQAFPAFSVRPGIAGDIPHDTIPFDRILKNTILCDGVLFFIDFEWTIAGPYEFTLARIAVEFNEYDNPEILSRVASMELYNLFLLRFYMYGQEPECVHGYMRERLRNPRLCELFDMINDHEYADKPWCSVSCCEATNAFCKEVVEPFNGETTSG